MINLSFTGSITVSSVKEFICSLELLCERNPEAQELAISISSPGGDVDLAIELYNFIKSLDCHIKTINTSYVNSAANIIYIAGDERICLPASSFYIHSVTKKLDGVYNIASLQREIQEMSTNTEKIAALLESSTSKAKPYWKRLMSTGQILTAKKAVELGLAHTVFAYN